MDPWDELGSGEADEGSTTDCDDEDGCQASGEGPGQTLHTEAKTIGKQPGGNSPQQRPSRPPSVKVIGGSASASWARHWSLALLFVALCLQWTLF